MLQLLEKKLLSTLRQNELYSVMLGLLEKNFMKCFTTTTLKQGCKRSIFDVIRLTISIFNVYTFLF
jgi:hypothetical protein